MMKIIFQDGILLWTHKVKLMSRKNPLEPLYNLMDEEDTRREKIKQITRMSVSWFVGFMLTASLIRYMVKYVQ